MGIDHSHDRLPSRVGDSPLPDTAVIVGDVLDEPFNGVVGVAAFVGVLRAAFSSFVRLHHDEIAFRFKLPPHVLVDEDKAFFSIETVGPQNGPVIIGSV